MQKNRGKKVVDNFDNNIYTYGDFYNVFKETKGLNEAWKEYQKQNLNDEFVLRTDDFKDGVQGNYVNKQVKATLKFKSDRVIIYSYTDVFLTTGFMMKTSIDKEGMYVVDKLFNEYDKNLTEGHAMFYLRMLESIPGLK
ncbi:hypothetical protein [Myroides sp. ZB35]|uniref:hypothetical protein n=1 Tax=Myroides sp. ZB35 TaxID=1458492 RepID=UPI0008F5531C|nr:hypothetical protein [Myroides sp. ZB35]APA91912.1 hypothetical protein BK054_06690 [Myroides sp. ZB35]